VRLARRLGGGVVVERVRAERLDGVLDQRHALEGTRLRVTPKRCNCCLEALVRRLGHAA
jgi:uncharacterized protein (UPF0179 family)